MSDRKRNRNPIPDHGTEQHAPLQNPEHGTMPEEASIQRNVGQRTPERREQEQLRNTGTEDVEALDNITWEETAPKQTTGGPAELDNVPNLPKP